MGFRRANVTFACNRAPLGMLFSRIVSTPRRHVTSLTLGRGTRRALAAGGGRGAAPGSG